jgi:cyclic pyranopterin phosphate synthase
MTPELPLAPRPRDTRDRPLHDLRISVTDRCNFRCVYCMPRAVFGPDHAFLPREEMLTFDEIARLVTIFGRLGVEKVRLTGGEPLVRRDLQDLVETLAEIPGVNDLTLTTNGVLLPQHAAALKAAGLDRVTISLDADDDETFTRMNDARVPVSAVLAGIKAAEAAGLGPIKLNMVVKRGWNEHAILPMARRFRGTGRILRFIEYMDVGHSNGWRLDDVVTANDILATVGTEFPLEPMPPTKVGEVAERYRYLDGEGEIGVIASVSRPFCGACDRARLSADGQLYTCLFANAASQDLRALLRQGAPDEHIRQLIVATWTGRRDRYSEIRASQTSARRRIEMSYIGG